MLVDQFIAAGDRSMDDQAIVGIGHARNKDCIASKHFGCNLGWIIAGPENDDVGVRHAAHETFKVAGRSHQDEVAH